MSRNIASPPAPRRRPGGRSARVQNAVFDATLGLLEQSGVADLSVKQIAAEAGVAETTIYRRWGSLYGVIAEAMSQLAVTENPIPDTGALASDLRELLRNVTGIIERPAVRRIFRFAMSLDDDDAMSARARTQFWQARFEAGTSVVQRAIARAEIEPLDDPEKVIETLVGAAYVRAFLLERPVTDAFLEECVGAAMFIAQGSGNSANQPS